MGILEGDAVCLGAGGFQNSFIIHTARQAGGEFGIDIGDKGLVGKLACDAACLCAAHSVAQRGDQAAFGLAFFENETILIVLADRALVCHAEAFHAGPCPPFCDFCIFLLSWPQEASTSLPSLRRTVTLTPLSSRILMKRFKCSGVEG